MFAPLLLENLGTGSLAETYLINVKNGNTTTMCEHQNDVINYFLVPLW